MRFEHFLQKSDDPGHLSQESRVNLNNLFSEITIESVRETTLAANQYIEEARRFQWQPSQEMLDDFNTFYGNQTEEAELDVSDMELSDQAQTQAQGQGQGQGQVQDMLDSAHLPGDKKLMWRRFIESNFPKHKSVKKYQRMGSKKNLGYLDPVVLNPMEIKTFIAEAHFNN